MPHPYWLFNWLDAHGIDNLEKARRALSDRAQLEDLREMAELAKDLVPEKVSGENVIVAGRGLDLSSQLYCSSSVCRQKQVDELFSRAWHYFDSIVVDDAVSHLVTYHFDKDVTESRRLLRQIEALLYFRKIGAEDLIEFREKPIVCQNQKHWRQHASEAGLDAALDIAESLVPTLLQEGEIRLLSQRKGISEYAFRHPNFEVIPRVDIKIGGISRNPSAAVRRKIVTEVLFKYFRHLEIDINAAVSLGVPLGCTNWLHSRILSSCSESFSPANAAFELDLPVLDGIPVQTLMKLRRDEEHSFQRFRTALRRAMKEQINNSSGSTAKQISEQVRLDLIEPELQNIRSRLKAAQNALTRKSAVGVFLGGLVTTCGVLAGIPVPISIAAGVGTVASTEGSAAAKYIDDRQTVALSDMYFLWKASEHAPHSNE